MDDIAEVLRDATYASQILVERDVLDSFGHVSVRDPNDPRAFWLARACPPRIVTPSDYLLFGMNGEPVQSTKHELFGERYIHSAIYAARPDVKAICHHHAPAILPFCIGAAPLLPVSQTGAFLRGAAVVWDSADEFGDTCMLVTTHAEAASLARALGDKSVVLMRGHGATVVGRDIKDMVFKSVYSCNEATHQWKASFWGPLKPLTPGEIEMTGEPKDPAIKRCWMDWTANLKTVQLPK